MKINLTTALLGLGMAVAYDFRKFWIARKEDPKAKFDPVIAILTWFVGTGAGIGAGEFNIGE